MKDKTLEAKRCPLCGESSALAGMGPAELALLRCLGCLIVFLATNDAAAYVEQVQEEFFAEMDQGSWQRVLDSLNSRMVLRRIRKHKPRGRLLEIGIGNGNFIRAAQRSGYECMGVEASRGLVASFNRKSSIPVFVGYLEEFVAKNPAERFDVLIMNHVLEHIPDPLAALKSIRGLLKDGGIAHIAVPNIAAWEANLQGWNCYEPYHLFYFAPQTLSALAKRAGFNVIKVKTAERFSGWTNALARTMLRTSYRDLRVSGARSSPSAKQKLSKLALDIARVGVGTATLPIRYVQSACHRGEELITILSLQ